MKEITEDRFSCNDCCKNIDVVYNFRKKCLETLPILLDYVNGSVEDDEDTMKKFEYSKDENSSEESEDMDDYSNEGL